MTRLPPSVDEALRAAIRAELNMLFEEKLKPLIEPRQIEAMQVSATPLFVSTAEAAKMVGVSVGTVQACVRANRLPGYKAGRLLPHQGRRSPSRPTVPRLG